MHGQLQDAAIPLITLGGLFLAGLLSDFLSPRVRLPRVTLLIVFGALAGPSSLGLLPDQVQDWYPLISSSALLLIGFLLGKKLSLDSLRRTGGRILGISLFKVFGATVAVFVGLRLAGLSTPLALVLAGIAPATAPAAVASVVQETRARGRFTDTLLGIVAIDDAWGLILFSVLLAVAQIAGAGGDALETLSHGATKLAGALVVGLLLGLAAARINNLVREEEPMQSEALGFILLAGGLAIWSGSSFILAAMILGATVASLSPNEERTFSVVRHLEWPILVLFFILAGASLDWTQLAAVSWLVPLYIVLRAAGLISGAFAGGQVLKAGPEIRNWMGFAVLPQAGVALGMALLAEGAVPEAKGVILPLVIGSTIVFEILGPVLTQMALRRSGNASGAD